MAIPTTRTNEKGSISIDIEKCNGCGLCVSVCKDFSITIENGKAVLSNTAVFGCVACGHCMAICPEGAIKISGRTLSPGDVFELPDKNLAAGYDQVMALLQRRRSIREFKDQQIDDAIIEQILKAARTAPMGLPPSDVNVLVISGKEKNAEFVNDFSHFLQSVKWMVSKPVLAMMSLFMSKTNSELYASFINPIINLFITSTQEGKNWITYDAPLVMYFYGSPYCDPADPIIAATYAMIAAETLGLGTCMIGGVHPFIQYGKKAKQFREKYQIKYKSREGLLVIFGYPAVHYKNGITRTFATETILKN